MFMDKFLKCFGCGSTEKDDTLRVQKQIFDCALKGDHHKLTQLVEQHQLTSVDFCDENGLTPLMIASRYGCLSVVTYLVTTLHVDITLTDKRGYTAREIAEKSKQHDVVKIFEITAQDHESLNCRSFRNRKSSNMSFSSDVDISSKKTSSRVSPSRSVSVQGIAEDDVAEPVRLSPPSRHHSQRCVEEIALTVPGSSAMPHFPAKPRFSKRECCEKSVDDMSRLTDADSTDSEDDFSLSTREESLMSDDSGSIATLSIL